ncbi:MAG: MobA/MobL family protein [Clostridia bacterium]|nr:MobA/MobL family protein [Clostridia bacterium]
MEKERRKKGGEAHIPCPHYNITIIARGKVKGNSVVGAAAYQSGDKIYSEYEHEWKSGDHLERIIHKEILLPPNAPEKYRDRATLWNAVDASETKATAQTARRIIMALPKELTQEQNIELIRNYCQTSFVDRGMIADFAVHDDNEGNPHAHVLLTMRSINEQGEWNPKTRTEFILDENGEPIQTANGKFKRRCVSWDGWNDRGNCEIWRHEWEVMQNAALEKAGREERIDMRSFERQGIELAPTVHLGPAASALEKKGIHTELGDQNRIVKAVNGLLIAIKNKLKALLEWMTELTDIISDQKKLESPGDYPLLSVLMAYYDLREKERWDWSNGARNKGGINDLKEKAAVLSFMKDHDIYSIKDFARLLNATSSKIREMESGKKAKEKRIRDIDAILDAVKTLKELNPIREKYNGIHFAKSKEKYRQEHADELARIDKANRLLHKLNVTLPINSKTLRAEFAQLRAEVEAMLPELENVKAELDEQMKIRTHVRKVLPEALTLRCKDGQKRYEDVAEEVQNQQELRELLDHTAETAVRRSEEIEQGNPTPSQIQEDKQPIKNQQTKERQKSWQKGER